MKFSFFFIFFLSFFILGCGSPDPNPENKDPIYQDIQKDINEVGQQIASEQKNLDEHLKDLALVKPQTGQIKYAEKRVSESQAKLDKLKQKKMYLGFRLESRLKHARESYLKAYKSKQSWPNPAEYDEYMAQKKLDQAPIVWDAKARLEEYHQQLENIKKQGTKKEK